MPSVYVKPICFGMRSFPSWIRMHDKLLRFSYVLANTILILEGCHSGNAVNFKATDVATSFQEGNCSCLGSEHHLAYLNNSDTALSAGDQSELAERPLWIRFCSNLAKCDAENGSCLGIEKNFTKLSDGFCVAITGSFSREKNKSSYAWIAQNCSSELKTLCTKEASDCDDNGTSTTNTDIFRSSATTVPITRSGTTSSSLTAARSSAVTTTYLAESTTFTNAVVSRSSQPAYSRWSSHHSVTTTTEPDKDACDVSNNATTHPIALQEELVEKARNEGQECQSKLNNFVALIVPADKCNESRMAFGLINASCPTGAKQQKYAIASIPASQEVVDQYAVENTFDYHRNRRIKKIMAVKNVFLSYSVLSSDNESNTEFQITFVARLHSNESLLTNAFNLTFENGNNGLLDSTHRVWEYQPECVFINESIGQFDTSGCTCTEVDGDRARCVSNHTTVFAVLLAVDTSTVPPAVKVLSVVTLAISLFFLAVAFFILFRVRKKVRGERIAIQMNLVVSLFFMCFVILWGDIALHNPTCCRMVAVLTNYFTLSTAFWMTNEAILLFLKTSKWAFLTTKRRKLVISTMVFAWGTAFLLCCITVIVGFSKGTYMDETEIYKRAQHSTASVTDILQYDYCWLSGESGIRWAVIVPVALLLLVNLAISVKVAVFVYRKRKETENFKPTEQVKIKHKLDVEYLNHLSASIKAFAMLMPTLGLPWLLLFISNSNRESTRIAFMYISTIVNGLQGVFIFVLYCVVGKEVRAATAKTLSSFSSNWMTISENLDNRRKKSGVTGNDIISRSSIDNATNSANQTKNGSV